MDHNEPSYGPGPKRGYVKLCDDAYAVQHVWETSKMIFFEILTYLDGHTMYPALHAYICCDGFVPL